MFTEAISIVILVTLAVSTCSVLVTNMDSTFVYFSGEANKPSRCSSVPDEISDDVGGWNPICLLGGQ